MGTFAGTTSLAPQQKYVYIQTNPIIDDSWLGTRVTSSALEFNSAPVNIEKPSIYTLSAGEYQVSDGSWILPNKITHKNPNTEKNLPDFNSAPMLPVAQSSPPGFDQSPFVTPNGTAFVDISGHSSSFSSSALVNNGIINGNQSVSGNSVISGNQTI